MQNYFCRRKEVGQDANYSSRESFGGLYETNYCVIGLTNKQNQEEKTNETHTKQE